MLPWDLRNVTEWLSNLLVNTLDEIMAGLGHRAVQQN